MSLLFTLARTSRGLLIQAVLWSALGGAASSALVALINAALSADRATLPALGAWFAVVCGAMWLARYRSQAQFAMLEQRALAELRVHICRHLAAAPYRQLETAGQARVTALLVEDAGAVAEFFVMLPRVVMQGAVVIGCLTYLAILSLAAFAMALAVIVAGAVVHSWAVGRAMGHLTRARLGEDTLYAHFRALFAGAKELKLHAARRRAFLAESLAPAIEAVRDQRTRGLSIYVAAGSVGAFMFFVVIGCVIFLLGSLLDVAPEVRSAYALMFLFMIHPLESLLEALPELARARVALAQIEQVCGSELREQLQPRAAGSLSSIELSAVRHRYARDSEDGVFELGPISLALSPGELTFLVGGNGSGKTTLAKLLVGLYEPEAGDVLLDGRPIDADSRASYRQTFSAVFADFHLFDRLFGLQDPASRERAAALLRALDLAHKVTIRDGAFSTTELSRGQQKRLALLVAWLEDRPAYVFDEWAADQDPAYKQVFYTQILPDLKARNKAVLVITHDDRYFGVADRVLRLEAGRLLPA